MNKHLFASDNASGVHPKIMEYLATINQGHMLAYGSDTITEQATELLKNEFGGDCEVFFVFNGTGANVLAMLAQTSRHQAIIATNISHLNCDESGAPERATGAKIIDVPHIEGKLTIANIEENVNFDSAMHTVQPGVISITQSTEMGTLYQPSEILTLTQYAHQKKMTVHMDGARISNAAVSLGLTFKQMTKDLGIDVVSFGGTKNGLLFGEAIVFLNQPLAQNFVYIRKQHLQLASKMRYLSGQFIPYLKYGIYESNARHSNDMAKLLESKIRSQIKDLEICYPVQANAVFIRATNPEKVLKAQREMGFYCWNPIKFEYRLMCSFDTTTQDIEKIVELLA